MNNQKAKEFILNGYDFWVEWKKMIPLIIFVYFL